MAIGVKQLAIWFFNAVNPDRINSRGKTIDFKNGGEPDEQVFRNFTETVYKKRVGTDFQDQATYSDINARVNIDKATTPDNLPKVSTTDEALTVTEIPAANETAPYKNYRVNLNKAVYADILAGDVDKVLTAANYPTVTSSSLTVTPVQDGNSIEFQIELPALPSVNLIIPITYADLVTAITNSTLQPGFWYQFPYQCIHQIPYTNVLNTSSTLTIPTETLLVQALTTNSLDRTQVRSLDHPQDIIHWRWEDNKAVTPVTALLSGVNINTLTTPPTFTGGAVSYISPEVNRPGRIYYREDTILRISTPYDFRGVVVRRYALRRNNLDQFIVKNSKSYANATLYKTHDIILEGGIYYIILKSFIASPTMSNHSYNYIDINEALSNISTYSATNPTEYIIYNSDSDYFINSKVELDVNSADFRDSFTIFGNAYNVHIENSIPSQDNSLAWEFYPNVSIVSTTRVHDINIGKFSYNITMYENSSVKIKNFCRDITLSNLMGGGNVTINDNSQNILITQDTNNFTVKVGANTVGAILSKGNYLIKSDNKRLFTSENDYLEISNLNYVVNYVKNIGYNILGSNTSMVCLNQCDSNTIGNNNNEIFNILGVNTIIKDFNNNVSNLKIESSYYIPLTHSNNVINNNNSNIIVSGSNNIYTEVSNLNLSNNSGNNFTIDNSVFEKCDSLSFIKGVGVNNINNCRFINSEDIIINGGSIIDSFIENSTDLTLSTDLLNCKIDILKNSTISGAVVSECIFNNISFLTLILNSNSLVKHSSFTSAYILTINITSDCDIDGFHILNSNNIIITSDLNVPIIVIGNTSIINTSSVIFDKLNYGISGVGMNDCNSIRISYVYLSAVNFLNCNNISSMYQYTPVPSSIDNVKIDIQRVTFMNVYDLNFFSQSNIGSSIANYSFIINNSNFINCTSLAVYTLASSVINRINKCTFTNVGAVSIGQIILDNLATQPLNYQLSTFENIGVSSGFVLNISTPSISTSSIKNCRLGGSSAGLCYRVSLVECHFDGIINIIDSEVSPNYSFRNTLTKFRGAGFYKKTTNASINTIGYNIDNRITFGAGALDLDTIPLDASDTEYKVQDGTKVYGIRNVISAGNIVETPVNLTLV